MRLRAVSDEAQMGIIKAQMGIIKAQMGIIEAIWAILRLLGPYWTLLVGTPSPYYPSLPPCAPPGPD